jgi:hypothetical protein
MTRPFFRNLFSFCSSLFLGFVVATFYGPPAQGQNYCGPNTVANFNSTNGAYPYAGVSFDSQGNMYGRRKTAERRASEPFGSTPPAPDSPSFSTSAALLHIPITVTGR